MLINRKDFKNIWFTSDWHYHHDRAFIYAHRGFNSIKEHDEFILDGWSSLISEDDLVLFLGDLTFMDEVACAQLMSKLKARKVYYILGNHDKSLKKVLSKFPERNLGLLADINIVDKDGKQPITLCHYPMLSWNKSHYGAWNLCGHSHGSHPSSLPNAIEGKRLEVSIDVGLKFNPTFMFTFEDVKRIMAIKHISSHH